jgi:hypothetical protein
MVAAAALGVFSTAGLMAGALVAAGLAGPMWWINASLRSVARRRGESLPSASWKLAVAGPLTQAVYLAALVSVSFLRNVDWRGINYELYGRSPACLTAYHPLHTEPLCADPTASIG